MRMNIYNFQSLNYNNSTPLQFPPFTRIGHKSQTCALIVEFLRVYCPNRITLNPAGTTQESRALTYPGVRVVTLVVVVGVVVVLWRFLFFKW